MHAKFTLIAGTAFLFSNGLALAQDWDWQPEPEHQFYERFVQEPVRTAPPADFDVSVGAVVPDAVELYDAPADYAYAPVHRYKYVTVQKRVYVVEPRTRRVVHVIER